MEDNKKGIHIIDEEGNEIDIDTEGISINGQSNCGHKKHKTHSKAYYIYRGIEDCFALIVLITYLLVGFLYKGTLGSTHVNAWAGLWPLFLLIPVLPTLRMAIERRRFCIIAYPLIIIAMYCFLGMLKGMWHPMWVLFFTIPVYYSVAIKIDIRNHLPKPPKDDDNVVSNQ